MRKILGAKLGKTVHIAVFFCVKQNFKLKKHCLGQYFSLPKLLESHQFCVAAQYFAFHFFGSTAALQVGSVCMSVTPAESVTLDFPCFLADLVIPTKTGYQLFKIIC